MDRERKLHENEKKYRLLFESMRQGVFYQAADGKIVDANEAALRMLGINRKQIMGKDSFDPRWKVINENYDILDPLQHPSMVALKSGKKVDHQIVGVYIPEEKQFHWLIIDAIPQFHAGEEIPYQVFACMEDITAIKEAEDSLKASYSLLEIAGKTANFGGWSLQADSGVVIWSDEVAAIHEMPAGYSPSLDEGINFYVPAYQPVIQGLLQECLSKGIPFDENLQIMTANGRHKWVRATGMAIRDSGRQITQLKGSFQDIHDFKTTEGRLQDAKDFAESLIRTANAIVIGMDILGNIHTFNHTAEKITGYRFDDLNGKNWFDTLCPKEKYPQVWKIFEKASEGQLPKLFENPILTKDGVEKIIQWHNSEIIESGEITGTISFGLDVTQQRITEAINEVRLRLIQYSMDHTLDELLEEMLNEAENLTKSKIGFVHFVEDDQENLVLQNWSKRTKEEYCRAEAKGAHYSIARAGVWVDCIHERKPVVHNDYNALAHRKGLPDGHAAVIRELVVPVIRGDKIVAVLGVGNKEENYHQQDVETLSMIANLTWDITERKQTEAEILRINRELKEAIDTKDKFFSIIAHDLRSPFSSILGLSDMLKSEIRNLDTKEMENLAGLISKSAGHTLQLLDNLLNWARMQQGSIKYQPENILLHNFVNDVIWILKESALQKNITIRNKIPARLIVRADENMITVIIRNLISNAIKFTNSDGYIEVSVQTLENQTIISISDSGVGMSDDQIRNLFYVGSNRSTQGTNHEKGTGLGLILCREFVEKHDGKIWVSSTPGNGSEFSFSIPVEK